MENSMASGAPAEKKRRMNMPGPVELDLCVNQRMIRMEQPNDQLRKITCVFAEMMSASQFADVTVISGSVEFPAHKVVLFSRIPFFKEALLHDTAGENTIEVPPEISSDIVKKIIDYAYWIEPEVTSENAQALLEAAAFFRIEDLWDFCDKFIAEWILLTEQNCFPVQTYAIVRSAVLLAKKAEEFITRHFVDFVGTDEFRSMSEKEITSILKMKDICCLPREEMFWEALVKWIEADVEDRKPLMPKLFGLLRLSHLSTIKIVEKVAAHPYIDSNLVCREMVREVVSYKLNPNNIEVRKRCEASFNLQKRSEQMSPIYHFDINSFGEDEDITSPDNHYQRIQVFRNLDNKWVEVDWGSMPKECREIFIKNVAVVKSIVYCVTDGNLLVSYDLATKTWTTIQGDIGRPNLKKSKLCCINRKLVACGPMGEDSQMLACSYDPSTNSWEQIILSWTERPFTESIRCCGLSCSDSGNADSEMLCVYFEQVYDAAVLLFDMQTGCLIKRGKNAGYDLSTYNMAIASYDGKVFVADGLLSVRVYDVALDQWSSLPRRGVERIGVDLAQVGDRLYAIGGIKDDELCTTVEYMDLTENNPHWQSGPKLLENLLPGMLIGNCAVAVACECNL